MALDGIVIKNIVSELNKTLTGSRVDRIYQPERDELTVIFPEGRLTVSVNPSCKGVYEHGKKGKSAAGTDVLYASSQTPDPGAPRKGLPGRV